MSNFFSDEQLNNITLTKDNIENVTSFSSINPNITLADIERLQQQNNTNKVNINVQQISNLNTTSPIADREFKKQVDKQQALIRARVKIFITTFLLITCIITGFVIYNLISIMLLNNKIENNNIKIKARMQQQTEQQETVKHQTELDEYIENNIFL